jgi:hypothetical protein
LIDKRKESFHELEEEVLLLDKKKGIFLWTGRRSFSARLEK